MSRAVIGAVSAVIVVVTAIAADVALLCHHQRRPRSIEQSIYLDTTNNDWSIARPRDRSTRSRAIDEAANVDRIAPPMAATGNDPPETVIIKVVVAVRFAD
jgi:hypothetical protein